MSKPFMGIEQAIEHIAHGKMLILVDDENRENEGDLIIAARHADAEAINFMAKYGRGLICLPMASHMIDRLNLPMMVENNGSKFSTAFTVSIEAATGVSTGISASDRSHTIQTAIKKDVRPQDIISPGHVFPLKARDEGVLVRPGQTEGSVDLARMAGLEPAAVICEIINDDGTMARLPDLEAFSVQHNIPIVTVNDLIAYRLKHEVHLKRVAECTLPVAGLGDFEMEIYESEQDSLQHIVLKKGDLTSIKQPLVRLHSECLTGDIFSSKRCDCGQQLEYSLAQIAEHGGLLLYLRQEGRGIGLVNKIKAYALQEQGMDTVEANQHLGFADDNRDYNQAAKLLAQMGVTNIRLLTNNPRKIEGLQSNGINIVERVGVEITAHEQNEMYLHTKKNKLGHMLKLDNPIEHACV